MYFTQIILLNILLLKCTLQIDMNAPKVAMSDTDPNKEDIGFTLFDTFKGDDDDEDDNKFKDEDKKDGKIKKKGGSVENELSNVEKKKVLKKAEPENEVDGKKKKKKKKMNKAEEVSIDLLKAVEDANKGKFQKKNKTEEDYLNLMSRGIITSALDDIERVRHSNTSTVLSNRARTVAKRLMKVDRLEPLAELFNALAQKLDLYKGLTDVYRLRIEKARSGIRLDMPNYNFFG
ncbi:hypothetical protein SNEBB_005591 [Seison nebaliae]|nr:hypothetical protein SNEBB_005591 [Seison nebaliae]